MPSPRRFAVVTALVTLSVLAFVEGANEFTHWHWHHLCVENHADYIDCTKEPHGIRLGLLP